MRRQAKLGPVEREYEGARLGDERRNARLIRVAQLVEADPSGGFPRAMGSDAELEAFYRFINNDNIPPSAILEPHVAATMARARAAGTVLAIHDSSFVEMCGSAPREGMGVTTTNNRQGFLAHIALLVSEDGRTPLGIADVQTLTRSGTKWRARKHRRHVEANDVARESLRWVRSMEAVEQHGQEVEVVHVADAEGDFFHFLSKMSEHGARFVIRAGQLQRTVQTDRAAETLRDVVDRLIPKCFRNIELNSRRYTSKHGGYNTRRKHPPRAARKARVGIAGTKVRIEPTKYSVGPGRGFDVHVVRVWEEDPPRGQQAVEWVLLTTESIDSSAALRSVVDKYRARWMIEEYFKALKTGCSLERRQIESYAGMRRVLALLAPIAFRLLLLRGLERTEPTSPASRAFDEVELLLIAKAQARPTTTPKTVGDALALVARLGGHIKNNGPPGWMTLGAGYEKLLTLKLGWQLGQKSRGRSDQW